MKVALIGALALSLVGTVAQAQTTSSGQTTPAVDATAPDTFVTQAGIGNQFEIDEGRLAIKRSSSPEIKKFAHRMVTDHGKALSELKKIVAKDKLGKVPAKLDADNQASLDALKKAKGADFDKAYVADQLKAHQGAAALFSQYAQNGSQPDLKTFATNTLPTIQDHLKHVQMLSTGQ
jgi:putative membrane protein